MKKHGSPKLTPVNNFLQYNKDSFFFLYIMKIFACPKNNSTNHITKFKTFIQVDQEHLYIISSQIWKKMQSLHMIKN